jgi:hypothetical protein
VSISVRGTVKPMCKLGRKPLTGGMSRKSRAKPRSPFRYLNSTLELILKVVKFYILSRLVRRILTHC